MNKIIRDNIVGAGMDVDGYGYPIWGCLHSEEEKNQFLEKFAELIVGECANAAEAAHEANCEYPGDYIVEQMGYGVKEGAANWRVK